jgi:type IV pilus assembly protein PilA
MKALQQNGGFTLVEQLVVVALLGILAAIAIPQFVAYRQERYDARAESDLRNAATAEQAVFARNGAYVDLAATTGPARPAALPGLSISSTVRLQMTQGGPTFTGSSKSSLGSGVTCHWDSNNGGFTGCS